MMTLSIQSFSAKVEYRTLSLHLTIYESGPGYPGVVFIPEMGSHAGTYADLIPEANFLRALAEKGFNVPGPATCSLWSTFPQLSP